MAVRDIKRWSRAWVLLAAVIAAFLARQLNNPFYADDYLHLAFIKFMQDPARVLWMHFFGQDFWRPMVYLANLLSFKIFGLRPAGWHGEDLAIHSLNALLLAMMLDKIMAGMKSGRLFSIMGGLLFAIHPLALLTAAWIACRADLLAVFFALLAMNLVLAAFQAEKFRAAPLLLALPLALLGFVSKESVLTLPATAAVMIFFFGRGGLGWRKTFYSLAAFGSLAVVLALYFVLRLKIFGSFKGYEQVELSAGWLFPRLCYHLPRVLSMSFKDYALWHLPARSGWAQPMIWSYLLLALISIRSVRRSPRFFIAGVLWILIALAPVWNLSHMFVYGEARMLYFGLAGLPIILCGALAGIENSKWRAAGAVLLMVVLALLGRESASELNQFKVRSELYEKVREQAVRVIMPAGSVVNAKRIYVYGLDFDFYYLDPMLKAHYPQLLDRMIVPASMPTLAWVSQDVLQQSRPGSAVLPRMQVGYTDQKTALVSITPPEDLVQAPSHDPQSMVLEWNGSQFADISAESTRLFHRRLFMQANYAQPRQLKLLPNYSFRKRNYPLDWKTSGLKAVAPFQLGAPYDFVATGNDPWLVSPELDFPALAVAEVELRMRVGNKQYLAPQEEQGCFFWMADKDTDWTPNCKICFPVIADGEFHAYQIRADRNLYWLRSSNVSRVRIDPISFPGKFQLDYINFSPAPSPE